MRQESSVFSSSTAFELGRYMILRQALLVADTLLTEEGAGTVSGDFYIVGDRT